MSITTKIAEFVVLLITTKGASGADSVIPFLEAVILLLILLGGFYANRFLDVFPIFRKYFGKGEEYAGEYVQVIDSNEERRYAVLHISYDRKTKSYILKGMQYGPDGSRLTSFESDDVSFRKGQFEFMEFTWLAKDLVDFTPFEGYTQMKPDDPKETAMLEGLGFFVTFDLEPGMYKLWFFKVTKKRMKWLELDNLEIPKNENQRDEFVIRK